jgi:hypothetical protein
MLLIPHFWAQKMFAEIWMGFIFGWIYFRFLHPESNFLSESFELASFFPHPIRPIVVFLVSQIERIATQVGLTKPRTLPTSNDDSISEDVVAARMLNQLNCPD